MAIGAILAAVAGSVVSAGLAAATRPDIHSPDYGAATRAGVEADIETLPIRRAIEAAARTGSSVTVPVPWQASTERRPFVEIQGERTQGGAYPKKLIPYVEDEWKPGGKYNTQGQTQAPPRVFQDVQVPGGGSRTFDFTGQGDAQLQGEQARRMAQVGLNISRRFAPQFIDVARAQEKQADPEGWAARELMSKEVMRGLEDKSTNPVADRLMEQMSQELRAGDSSLTPEEQAVVRDLIRRQVAAGEGGPSSDIEARLTKGLAGEERRARRTNAATTYAGSGNTPTDIAFRRHQQAISNAGAFLGGQTPTAQFGQLSGAQQGAAPVLSGGPLPGQNPNAGAQGAAGAATQYGQQVNVANTAVNPWFAGLGAALRGTGSLAAAGRI